MVKERVVEVEAEAMQATRFVVLRGRYGPLRAIVIGIEAGFNRLGSSRTPRWTPRAHAGCSVPSLPLTRADRGQRGMAVRKSGATVLLTILHGRVAGTHQVGKSWPNSRLVTGTDVATL